MYRVFIKFPNFSYSLLKLDIKKNSNLTSEVGNFCTHIDLCESSSILRNRLSIKPQNCVITVWFTLSIEKIQPRVNPGAYQPVCGPP